MELPTWPLEPSPPTTCQVLSETPSKWWARSICRHGQAVLKGSWCNHRVIHVIDGLNCKKRPLKPLVQNTLKIRKKYVFTYAKIRPLFGKIRPLYGVHSRYASGTYFVRTFHVFCMYFWVSQFSLKKSPNLQDIAPEEPTFTLNN